MAPYAAAGLDAEDLVLVVLVPPARVDHFEPGGGIVQPARADLVRHAVVVDLADPGHEIALLLEELRQGNHVGKMLAEIRAVLVNLRHVGALAGPERGPARVAEGEAAIGAIEANAAAGEAVDVR